MTGMKKTKVSGKIIFTIFGASGDLADLKLFPAIFELVNQGYLEDIIVIGFARSEYSQEEFREKFRKSILDAKSEIDEDVLENLIQNVHYHQGKYSEARPYKDYADLVQEIGGEYEQEIFHFSVPPSSYEEIIRNVYEIRENDSRVKYMIEKPFGEDLESAKALEFQIKRLGLKDVVYLIDHYLGKNAVRSILSLRKNNRVFNMLLKGHEISNIQISALEKLLVESRLNYYDNVGATRDMFQSHLLQLLSLLLVEIPVVEDESLLLKHKENLIDSVILKKSVFGQYEGYCERDKFQCSPFTDTLFAFELQINNDEWFDTPVYVRSGKGMNRKQTSVVIEFKKYAHQDEKLPPNKMIIEIAPNPCVKLFFVNESGYESEINSLVTKESLSCGVDECLSSHAVLFLDCLLEKKEFFVSFKQAVASWEITEEALNNKVIEHYPIGSSNVESSDKLLEEKGFKWINLND